MECTCRGPWLRAASRRWQHRVRRFARGESAISVTEYGIMVAFLALLIIAVVVVTGGNLSAWFATKTNAITTN